MKVIFRIEYDPYMKQNKYLAIFPEQRSCEYKNNMTCLPFYKGRDGWLFEAHNECCYEYYRNSTKTIKDKTKLKKLKEVVEKYYNSMPGDKIVLKVRMKIS